MRTGWIHSLPPKSQVPDKTLDLLCIACLLRKQPTEETTKEKIGQASNNQRRLRIFQSKMTF